MLTTALDLVKGALRLCGALGESQPVSSEDAQIVLDALNEMLESWELDRNAVYVVRQDDLLWPAGVVARTIGPGGDFDIKRPVKLAPGTYMRDLRGVDWYLHVIDQQEERSGEPLKTQITSTYPYYLFYRPDFPIAELELYPVPAEQITVFLFSRKELQEFSSLTDSLMLPPGYRRAIRYNLAVAIEPEFVPGALPASVVAIAQQSLAAVKRLNLPRGKLTPHSRWMYGSGRWGSGRYSARTGQIR